MAAIRHTDTCGNDEGCCEHLVLDNYRSIHGRDTTAALIPPTSLLTRSITRVHGQSCVRFSFILLGSLLRDVFVSYQQSQDVVQLGWTEIKKGIKGAESWLHRHRSSVHVPTERRGCDLTSFERDRNKPWSGNPDSPKDKTQRTDTLTGCHPLTASLGVRGRTSQWFLFRVCFFQ